MSDTYFFCLGKVEKREANDLVRNGGQPLQRFASMVRRISGGLPKSSCVFGIVDDSGTDASHVIAVTAASVGGGETLTFSLFGTSVVLTVGTEIELDTTSDTTQAAALVAAFNEHPLLHLLGDAANASGTVTITWRFPGDWLESVSVATSDAPSFAITAATGTGADGDCAYFPQGKRNV